MICCTATHREPDEAPVVTVLRQSRLRARKPHVCTEWGCRKPIEPGQSYIVVVAVVDGAFEVTRIHPSHRYQY